MLCTRVEKEKNLNFKIVVIAVIFLVIFGLTISIKMNRSNFFGEGIVKDVITMIDKVVMYPLRL